LRSQVFSGRSAQFPKEDFRGGFAPAARVRQHERSARGARFSLRVPERFIILEDMQNPITPKALRPGDTIHLESEVVEMRTLKSRAGTGLVKFRCITINQRGEPVQTMLPNLFVSRKMA